MTESLDDFLLELRRFRDEIASRGQQLAYGTHGEVLRLIEEKKQLAEKAPDEPSLRSTGEKSR